MKTRFSFSSQSIEFPPLPDPAFLDYDVNPDGELVYARSAGHGVDVHFPGGVTQHVPVPLSGVRWFAPGRALVFDYHVTDDERRSAWSIGEDGTCRVEIAFLGDALADLSKTENYAVATYYDEGVFGDYPISQNGLSVFDKSGNLVLGWNAHRAEGLPYIYDCYCALNLGEDCIAVHIYTKYRYGAYAFGILDIPNRSVTMYEAPSALNLTSAMTRLPSGLWCSAVTHLTENRHEPKQRLLVWRPGENGVTDITSLGPKKRVRGLPNGKFLEETQSGADVVTVSDTSAKPKALRNHRSETFRLKPE